MEKFKMLPLSEIAELVIDYRGKTPKKLGGDWSVQGYRAISAKNVKTRQIVQSDSIRYLDESLYRKWMKEEIKRGDILITSEAPFGQLFYWDSDEKIVLSQRLFALRCKKEFYSPYIFHYMTSDAFQSDMECRATGTTVTGLRQPELLKCRISVPSFEKQKIIADTLSTIDAKIENNKRINHHLEQIAFAIFDDMFPNVSLGSKLVGEYIVPKRGKGLLSKDAIAGKVPVVAGGLQPATYHNTANTVAPVITISASGANAGYVNLWSVPVWSSDSSFIDSSMSQDVYFWYVMLKKRQQEIYESQTGSAQPHIYPKHIEILPTIELSQESISVFTTRVTPIFTQIGKNFDEIQVLQNTRDVLLPKLISGDISVTD